MGLFKKLRSKLPTSWWKRWLVYGVLVGGTLVLTAITIAVSAYFIFTNPTSLSWVMRKMMTHQFAQEPQEPGNPKLKPEAEASLSLRASNVKDLNEFFSTKKIWAIHLNFSAKQWEKIAPIKIPHLTRFLNTDGSIILRNPAASRPGLLGVLGMDLPWSSGSVQLGDMHFTNAGIRFKGNGTFVESAKSYKRPFKIDLSRGDSPTNFIGRSTLNLANLSADRSYIQDPLGYQFFREAGVPTPRTTFARVLVSLEGRWDKRLLGLYEVVENPDDEWARDRFAPRQVSLFKPVTEELFKDLGTDWKAYEPIYNPKSELDDRLQKRLMELCKFVTSSTDEEYAKAIWDYIDLKPFATFMACQVMTSNYDSFICNGQNYLMYLDRESLKFGFIPWDLDHGWGEFGMIVGIETREQASITKPWVGDNRFLERTMALEAFQKDYRSEIDRLLKTLFTKESLYSKIDDLTNNIRPMVVEEANTNRLAKFEQSVSDEWIQGPREGSGNPFDENRPAHQIKRFIENRIISLKDQLDGKSQGRIPQRGGFGGPPAKDSRSGSVKP